MSHKFKLGAIAMSISMVLAPTTSFAEEEATADASSDEKVVILGSRGAPRSVADSPVPIDLISGDDFANSTDTNMLDAMKTLVPSFNVNTQPISDAATMVRPANMRGLPPDNTLVLLNGKRRHRSAVITFLGAGLSDGSQGPDILTIPSLALSQVEVLRDGAAAQYGSDAIAGVMNFVLKSDNSGGTFKARLGEFFEGDGDTIELSGNVGLPLTDHGFANISYQFKESGATTRNIQRDDAAALIAAGNTAVADPAQVWGQPDISGDHTLFINSGLDLDDGSQLYFWGGTARRKVDGGFFYRNPTNRGGVYNGPVLDGSNYGGAAAETYQTGGSIYGAGDFVDTILTGDMNGTDNSACPIVRLDANGIPDQAALSSLQAAGCWAFNLMFPGGFTPRFGGTVSDSSLAFGIKGEFDGGTAYDFSLTSGRSDVSYSIRNTINASMGADSPNEFNPGRYINEEQAFNMDFTKDVPVDGMDYPMTIAYGYEYRHEAFTIVPGDPASYEVGPLASQGFGIGSNGFPGFQDKDGGTNSRTSHAAYFDLQAQVTDDWLVGFALRAEDFSDFGSTSDGKLSTQYHMTDSWSVRGSVSTGFRAPTVGQTNVRNVTTAFAPDGGLQDEATLPASNPVAIQKGATPLGPEEAESYSFGFVGEIDDLFMTLDFYRIDISDRIATTSNFQLTQADIDALLVAGVSDATSFSSVRYFTNDFSTRTEGVDLVMNYSLDHWGGRSTLALVSSYTKTDVTDRDPAIISDTRKFQLESTLPKYRSSLTWNHNQDDWTMMARMNYYGDYTSTHLDAISLLIDSPAETTFDAAFTYHYTDNLNLTVGAMNLFDEYPVKNTDFAGIVGAEYILTHPMGFSGGYYYAEASYRF